MVTDTTIVATPAVRWQRVLAVATLAVCGTVLLTALGVWQLERRIWKLDLIHRVQTRSQVQARPLPPDATRDPVAHEYERVQVNGSYLPSHDTWVHASTELGTGYWVLSPLMAPGGQVVLINRGFVPLDTPRSAVRPPAVGSVTGILRVSESRSSWPRRNEPDHDRWYARDVSEIARVRALTGVAPFFVDSDATADDATVTPTDRVHPIGGLTVVHFRNAHLSYALTWFALALMTAIAGAHLLRGELLGYDRSG